MDFSEVRELIGELAHETVVEPAGALIQSLVPPRPDRRLALGWARGPKNQARLEIRINREDGMAKHRALEIRDKRTKGEARILIMESAKITPKSGALATQAIPTLAPSAALCLGASIGHPDGGPGSVGGFAEDAKGNVVVLSCHHVLKPTDSAKIADPIFHPGRRDVPRFNPDKHQIGKLSGHTIFAREELNDADFAWAQLDPKATLLGNVIPGSVAPAHANAHISGVTSPDEEVFFGRRVGKIGRTTGYTEGTINADQLVTGLTVLFPGNGNFMFGRIVEIRWDDLASPFTMDGDSGSLVFTTDDRSAIGLHFAASSAATDIETGETIGLSYAFALDSVLGDMELTWLT